jgi:hypothetical protein
VLPSENASGHAFRKSPAVNGSPMKVTSNPVSVANTAPTVFALRQVQRATRQRIDANLANQRSRYAGEVIVGAARRCGESLSVRSRPRMVRQYVQREPPQRRVSECRHEGDETVRWRRTFTRHRECVSMGASTRRVPS